MSILGDSYGHTSVKQSNKHSIADRRRLYVTGLHKTYAIFSKCQHTCEMTLLCDKNICSPLALCHSKKHSLSANRHRFLQRSLSSVRFIRLRVFHNLGILEAPSSSFLLEDLRYSQSMRISAFMQMLPHASVQTFFVIYERFLTFRHFFPPQIHFVQIQH